jgi:multidrug resistance efflux pump
MTSRWREENYFRYARAHFALDALDFYATVPGNMARLVPNPARKTAAAAVSAASKQVERAEADRAAKLAALRRPAPGTTGYITNQLLNRLDGRVEAARDKLQAAGRTPGLSRRRSRSVSTTPPRCGWSRRPS